MYEINQSREKTFRCAQNSTIAMLLTNGAFRVRNKQGRFERIHLIAAKDLSCTLYNSEERTRFLVAQWTSERWRIFLSIIIHFGETLKDRRSKKRVPSNNYLCPAAPLADVARRHSQACRCQRRQDRGRCANNHDLWTIIEPTQELIGLIDLFRSYFAFVNIEK